MRVVFHCKLISIHSYKGAGEALRRKQDKEREAAGLPPVQRVGARGAAVAQRGQRGGPPARGGRGVAPPTRGGRGGGGPQRHIAADKNLYVHLLGNLRKKSLLPVVVFTFSKKRCEENAATLSNADLCSAVEKSEVHVAIEKALGRLKGWIYFPLLVGRLLTVFLKARTRSYHRSVVCGTCSPGESAFIMVACYHLSKKFVS